MSIKSKLQQLSFRTGVIVLLMCLPFYALSFVQVFFPVSTATKVSKIFLITPKPILIYSKKGKRSTISTVVLSHIPTIISKFAR